MVLHTLNKNLVDKRPVSWQLGSGTCTMSTFCSSHSVPRASRLEWRRSWEGTQPGQLTPDDQRDIHIRIPCHIVSCSAIKTKHRESVCHVAITEKSSWASCLWEVLSDCLCITLSFPSHPPLLLLIKLYLS